MSKFKAGDPVYWIEPVNRIRDGVVIRKTGDRYLIRAGYESGVRLPESRLYATYEDAEATLPPKPPEQRGGKGRWHWELA